MVVNFDEELSKIPIRVRKGTEHFLKKYGNGKWFWRVNQDTLAMTNEHCVFAQIVGHWHKSGTKEHFISDVFAVNAGLLPPMNLSREQFTTYVTALTHEWRRKISELREADSPDD